MQNYTFYCNLVLPFDVFFARETKSIFQLGWMGEREKADKGEQIFSTCPMIWYNHLVTLH